ncbi:MAG: AAA family ATPase [Candidatus Poribacteria bacterium]|nr:AAA family ATPase [Candidatus Poribacteria bacterium]
MSEAKDTQEQTKVEIAVENFGPIAEANIDLRPLTVFVGPSNTGKTYFATLVYALHGAFDGLSDESLFSPFAQHIVTAMAILSRLLTDLTTPKEEIHEMLNKLGIIERSFKLSDLPKEIRQKLNIIVKDTDFFGEELQVELKNCFDLNSISELMRLTGDQSNEVRVLLRIGERNHEYWNVRMRASESEVNLDNLTSLNDPTYDNMVLLPKGWYASGEFLVDDKRVHINGFGSEGNHNRYYLPAARSGIMQSHRVIAGSLVKRTTRVGLEQFPEIPTLSGVIAEFMQQIILYDEDRSSEFQMKFFLDEEISENRVSDLANALELDILAGEVRVKPSASGYPDFRYLPQGTNEEFRLSQTSSMVSELAPLVLYLRSLVQPGDTLIIEEPEAHLHPGAQADMAVILARLVRAGVRVIITTHSDWLLQEIGNLIRAGELEKAGQEVSDLPTSLQTEQVGIWHFQKNGKVEEIPYNRIDGVEPIEYLDVAEDLYNRSARLQNRLEEMKGDAKRESE